jgi:hypothetical protein
MQQQAEPDRLDEHDLARARRFIASCRWTYAKTVPQYPHEYNVRHWLTPEQQAEFDWLAAVIARFGYPGRFWQQNWRYLDIGEFKFWTSRTIDGSGAILNRARLEPEGQLSFAEVER